MRKKKRRMYKLFDENVTKQNISIEIYTIYMENMKITRRGLKFQKLYFSNSSEARRLLKTLGKLDLITI